jgi:hypothetical protein
MAVKTSRQGGMSYQFTRIPTAGNRRVRATNEAIRAMEGEVEPEMWSTAIDNRWRWPACYCLVDLPGKQAAEGV